MTKKNDQEIKKAKKNLKDAEDKRNTGAEFAGDYLDLQGVRFFKPKFAHTWLFQRMKTSSMCTASLNDFGVCVAYALSHTQKDVRNKLMAEISNGQIVTQANMFVIDNELTMETVEEVLEKLAYKVLNISTDDDEEETKEDEKKE